MKNNYVVKKVYRSFVLVSILTALTATLGILIDNIIVGRFLGVSALGAMGVVGPVSLILSAFSTLEKICMKIQVYQTMEKLVEV